MPYPSESVPIDYSTPPFPSLYWPIRAPPGAAQYLYYINDIWRFTLYWTLITFCLVHSAVAAWAVLMQVHSAMTQRRLLRKQSRLKEAKQSTPFRAGHRAPTVEDETEDESSSIRSPSGSVSATDTGKGSHLPQPLLLSNSPVLSTLGWVWIIPVVYLFIGGVEALLSGSLVGLIVGAVYSSGYFKMSTWTPFLWGIINSLVVILGSFRIQGGL